MSKNNAIRRLPGAEVSRRIVANTSVVSLVPRAREPISRSFGLIRGKFPSRKMGRMIHWESQLERDAIMLFEFSPGIAAYREQPLKTQYVIDGKVRRYTPDFELTFNSGSKELIEIKPAQKLLCREELRRFACIQGHLNANGHVFRILTEREIRQSVLLENLNVLLRYRQAALTPFERRVFTEKLCKVAAVTFHDLAEQIGGISKVWRLIDDQILFCDLQLKITEKTLLTTKPEDNFNDKIFF